MRLLANGMNSSFLVQEKHRCHFSIAGSQNTVPWTIYLYVPWKLRHQYCKTIKHSNYVSTVNSSPKVIPNCAVIMQRAIVCAEYGRIWRLFKFVLGISQRFVRYFLLTILGAASHDKLAQRKVSPCMWNLGSNCCTKNYCNLHSLGILLISYIQKWRNDHNKMVL